MTETFFRMNGASTPSTVDYYDPRGGSDTERSSNVGVGIPLPDHADATHDLAGSRRHVGTTTSTVLVDASSRSAFKKLLRKKRMVYLGLFTIFCVAIGTVALLIPKTNKNSAKVDPILAYQERFTTFRTILGNYSQPWTFVLPNSPQTKALQWLVFNDQTLVTNPVDEKRLVQRYALMTLFHACNGIEWQGAFAINPPYTAQVETNECQFQGVTCDETGSIVAFEAAQAKLVGQIPDELSLLTHLTSLNLFTNELQGTLPVSLFERLSHLEVLILGNNDFVSTIPTEIGLLTGLRDLELGQNSFTGPLPTTLQSLDIRKLHVPATNVTCSLPELVESWPNLEFINLFQTECIGTIPESISKLKRLDTFYVGPRISGTIPESIGQLTNMHKLEISGLGVVGTIPSSIGTLTKLDRLVLRDLGINGTIPTTLGALTNLQGLVITTTQVSGTIPTEIGKMSNLRKIEIYESTALTGTLPSELASLSLLERLWIIRTQLTGDVPSGLCSNSVEIEYPCSMTCSCCSHPCHSCRPTIANPNCDQV